MAVLEGAVSGALVEVGASAARGLHTLQKPDDYGALGHYRVAMLSGTMAAALAANSEVFQFRWPDATRFAAIYRVDMSAGSNVAATTAALIAMRMTVARSWTVAGSGGTRATMTGNNQKMRTSMGTSLVNDIGMATTGALTAGTKTLDNQDIGIFATGMVTGALTVAHTFPWILSTLFDVQDQGAHPLILAQNEGFVIRSGPTFPATATWHCGITVIWAELTAF